jgi:serine/threonine-protein kinase
VSDDDVAELVQGAVGVPGGALAGVDGSKKIAEMIDLMLLEFRSITKDEADRDAPQELETLSFNTAPPPAGDGGADLPLGGLADELEGPDPVSSPIQEESSVGAWFRGLIPR